jgi:pyruvate,orthophosphate dikinase
MQPEVMHRAGKSLYFFDEGDGQDKKLLGGKGAGLCEMTQLGLPVPPGFVITTEVCQQFYSMGERLPDGLMAEVRAAMTRLEQLTGRRFADPANPLLVSTRSGSAISMPGMMDTVLNLGLNEGTVIGLERQTGDARFAHDAYRRFLQLFGKIVLGAPEEQFATVFDEAKRRSGARSDADVPAATLKEVVREFQRICEAHTGTPIPSDPYKQLELAITAVFRSWNGKRAVDYRRQFNITPEMANGTAVNVVTMVFGNVGADSATGVVFTRDPATGERVLYGDYLANAQGEDIVAGMRTPKPIQELAQEAPQAYRQLQSIADKLERHYKEPQDLEFTIERGRLFMLQTRNAKMNADAVVRTSVDMCQERILRKEEAVLRVSPDDLEQLLHRRIDPKAAVRPLAKGVNASPGAAAGGVVFDADEAERRGRSGEHVILVREETKPEDIHGFFAAQGVLTSRGGKTSHAAVVARGMGKPCVVGCGEVEIDAAHRLFRAGSTMVREGEVITIDGSTGNVLLGEVPTIDPEPSKQLTDLLGWADDARRLGIRANADTPEMAQTARRLGAQGIGLCRTERMFNAPDRLPIVVEMILAETLEERLQALERLRPLQQADFRAILRAMAGYPVTIRLLDPPLHEFLPRAEQLQQEIETLQRTRAKAADLAPKARTLAKVRALAEVNPMLGHRGVRVGLSFPEIYEMQVSAIYEAAAELLREGVDVRPQIMVPQVALAAELAAVKQTVQRVAAEMERRYHLSIPIKYGTMIEVVRACVTADEIGRVVEFFSFGTNDLTQGTFSFSREDAEGKFLPLYLERGLLRENPFQALDEPGVGKLMEIAVKLGREANPDLEVGICGEHGGDPASIHLCHRLGLTYVSASPYRIPVARLAAAHAALKQ